MDTARQILRWSIPGWLYLLIFTTYWLTMQRVVGKIHFYDVIEDFPSKGIGAEGAAVLAAIGVPLGFVLYQIYFFFYGSVIRPFWIVNRDRGQLVISHLGHAALATIKQETGAQLHLEDMTDKTEVLLLDFPLYRLKPEFRNEEGRRLYEENLVENWEAIRYYLAHISIVTDSYAASREFTTLSDIYHALGSSRTAAFLAWISICLLVIVKCAISEESIWRLRLPESAIGLVIITGLAFVTHIVFSRARTRAFTSTVSFLKKCLSAHFSGSLAKVRGE